MKKKPSSHVATSKGRRASRPAKASVPPVPRWSLHRIGIEPWAVCDGPGASCTGLEHVAVVGLVPVVKLLIEMIGICRVREICEGICGLEEHEKARQYLVGLLAKGDGS